MRPLFILAVFLALFFLCDVGSAQCPGGVCPLSAATGGTAKATVPVTAEVHSLGLLPARGPIAYTQGKPIRNTAKAVRQRVGWRIRAWRGR